MPLVTDIADTHNFGQKVRLVIGPTEGYLKPRPVFWEWLFFDSNSPIKHALRKHVTNTLEETFIESLFQLKVQDQIRRGISSPLLPANQESIPKPLLLQTSAALLAYTFTFGIEDLHSGNIVLTAKGPAVIDAECVLTEMLVPNETLLFPMKSTSERRCGLNFIMNDISTNFSIFFESYISMSNLILRSIGDLNQVLSEFNDRINETPIRLIFRDTSTYYEYFKGIQATAFNEEELLQISRNDIPYFFNCISDRAVRYFNKKDTTIQALSLEHSFREMLIRRSKPICKLLYYPRIENVIKPIGALFLAKNFLKNQEQYDYGTDEGLTKNGATIVFKGRNSNYKGSM